MARIVLRAVAVGLLLSLGVVFGVVPSEVASAQPKTFAYVVNMSSDNVTVIDTSSNTAVATIPVGDSPFRVAFSNDGAKAYVTNSGSNTVSVISTATHSVVTTVPVGVNPLGIAVSPDGAKAYVTNNGSGSVSIIDTATDAVSGGFTVSAPGVATVGVAFSPDGTHFLVSGGPGSNSIQEYAYPSNTHTGAIGGVIGSGERISFLDATTAFVVNGCGQCGNLQKVSTASNSVVNTLSLGDFGQGLAIAPSGASLVAGRGGVSPQVQRIDPASVTVTGSLNMASFANGLAYTPDGGRLYASEQNLDRVVVIDPSALAVIGDPIPVGSGPVDIQMVKVPYAFSGFFQPVDNLPVLNRVTAGRSVPVKFSLGGDQGLDVLAAGFPKSEQISCDSTAPVDGIEETVTAGGSSLSYDATTDQYTYVWKTNRSWASSCRQFVMKLNDGTVHRANFMFK